MIENDYMEILLSFSNHLTALGISCILSGEKNIKVSISDSDRLAHTLKDRTFDILIVDKFVLDNCPSVSDFKAEVLLLDTDCDEETINYALIAGHINGILDRNTDRKMLLKAFSTIMKHRLWISKTAMKQLVMRLSELYRLWNLKAIDLDILGLLGKGMDNVMIAKTLGTNSRNVQFRINNIQKKNDVRDRQDLINLSKQFNVFNSTEIDAIH